MVDLAEALTFPKALKARKDKAIEGIVKNPKWSQKFLQGATRMYQEAILGGNISDETPAAAALKEIYDQIIMGVEYYTPLEAIRQFTTDKSQFSIPVGTYQLAVEISSGAFSNLPKTTANVDVALDKEYGVEVTWTRAHLEDATWDVVAEQSEGAGVAIARKLVKNVTDLIAALTSELAGGGILDLTDPITYAEFLTLLRRVDVAGTGPVDTVFCAPAIYWQLLALDQFVSLLYGTSEEVMRTGVARLMLGATVYRVSDMEADAIYAFNSKKACAIVSRRDVTVEPFEYADANRYGFVAHVRSKAAIVKANAIAVGETVV